MLFSIKRELFLMQKSLMTMTQTQLFECACIVEPRMDNHMM